MPRSIYILKPVTRCLFRYSGYFENSPCQIILEISLNLFLIEFRDGLSEGSEISCNKEKEDDRVRE